MEAENDKKIAFKLYVQRVCNVIINGIENRIRNVFSGCRRLLLQFDVVVASFFFSTFTFCPKRNWYARHRLAGEIVGWHDDGETFDWKFIVEFREFHALLMQQRAGDQSKNDQAHFVHSFRAPSSRRCSIFIAPTRDWHAFLSCPRQQNIIYCSDMRIRGSFLLRTSFIDLETLHFSFAILLWSKKSSIQTISM